MRIYVRVSPRASSASLSKIGEGEYKARLTAPPVEGEANRQLQEILADHFKVAKSQIEIVGGKSSRVKMVDISG